MHENDDYAVKASEKAFGRRVREMRAHRGMSQRQLADAVGLDQSAVSRIEQGTRAVRLGEATVIATVLKIGLSELAPTVPNRLDQAIALAAAAERATRAANEVGRVVRQWISAHSQLVKAFEHADTESGDAMVEGARLLTELTVEDLVRNASAEPADDAPPSNLSTRQAKDAEA